MVGGVYIDDAGTPGVTSKSRYLHKDRKSWAAVIIPPDMESNLQEPLKIFLDGIRQDHNAKELHFTDIYSGRGLFKDVAISLRFELIDLMAMIFEKAEIPILFQTSSPEFLEEHRKTYGFPDVDIGWFSFDKHEHFSLLLLCWRVAQFIRKHRSHFPTKLPLIVDEGLANKGTSRELPAFGDVFQQKKMRFMSSEDCVHLQLADFAAFAIARSQWLQGRGDLKAHDLRFLEIVSPERLNIINLPTFRARIDEITAENYDERLQEDRLFKGFDNP